MPFTEAGTAAPTSGPTTRLSAAKQKALPPSVPASPINPSAPALCPLSGQSKVVPTSIYGARGFLHQQKLLDSTDDIITPALILNFLSHMINRPDVTSTIAAYIASIALVLPSAIELGVNEASRISELSEKIDKVLEKNEEISKPVEHPGLAVKLVALENKFGALTQLVEKLQVSTDVAENAATETQKSMIELHQTLVTEGAVGMDAPGPVLPGPPTFAAAARGTPMGSAPQARPLSAKQAVASAKRVQTQGAWITIQPDSKEAADRLAAYPARELVAKAHTAMDAAWKVLAAKPDFVGKPRPTISFRTARVLAKGGIRYDMGDRAQAAFLSHASVSTAFEKAFGEVSCSGQGAVVLLQCAPIDWNPEDRASLRALERENQLEPGTIVSAAWGKPIHLRKPDQSTAVVKLWLRSQQIADDLIIMGGQLWNAPVLFRMVRQEPTRCYKCQKYGHKGVNCKTLFDVCSGCGGPHRGGDCDRPDASHCVSCNSDEHCSWDRKCPIFKAEVEKLKRQNPGASSPLFDPTREAELTAPKPRPIHLIPGTLGEARTSNASGSNLRPLRNARAPQPRLTFDARARMDERTNQNNPSQIPGVLDMPPHLQNRPASPNYPLRPLSVITEPVQLASSTDATPPSPSSISSSDTA